MQKIKEKIIGVKNTIVKKNQENIVEIRAKILENREKIKEKINKKLYKKIHKN